MDFGEFATQAIWKLVYALFHAQIDNWQSDGLA